MDEVPDVVEVEAPARGREQMNWDINHRKELLFSQIIVAGVKAFLTNRANVKPDARGKGGQTYEKKIIWENPTDGIITMLKKSDAFLDAVWPSDLQATINYVDRVVDRNKHLYTSGMEQAEPADAGTEGTKDENLTDWQKVCSLGLCPALA